MAKCYYYTLVTMAKIRKVFLKLSLAFGFLFLIMGGIAVEGLTLRRLGQISFESTEPIYREEVLSSVELSQVFLADDSQDSSLKAMVVSADSRPLMIRRFLESYRSPLAPYADLIYQVSEERGIDSRYIPAIAMVESGACKTIPVSPYSYNCWGIGVHSRGTLRFASFEEAIVFVADYLKNELYDKGYTTPEEMMEKYCPLSNGSWAFGVRHFMAEME